MFSEKLLCSVLRRLEKQARLLRSARKPSKQSLLNNPSSSLRRSGRFNTSSGFRAITKGISTLHDVLFLICSIRLPLLVLAKKSGPQKMHKHKEFQQKPPTQDPPPWDPPKFFMHGASLPFKTQKKPMHKEFQGGGLRLRVPKIVYAFVLCVFYLLLKKTPTIPASGSGLGHPENGGNQLRCMKPALCIAAVCVAAMWCTTLRAKGTLISEPRFSTPCEMRFFPREKGRTAFVEGFSLKSSRSPLLAWGRIASRRG